MTMEVTHESWRLWILGLHLRTTIRLSLNLWCHIWNSVRSSIEFSSTQYFPHNYIMTYPWSQWVRCVCLMWWNTWKHTKQTTLSQSPVCCQIDISVKIQKKVIIPDSAHKSTHRCVKSMWSNHCNHSIIDNHALEVDRKPQSLGH